MDASVITALILGAAVVIAAAVVALIIKSMRPKTIYVDRPRERATETDVIPEPKKLVRARLMVKDDEGFQNEYTLEKEAYNIGREEDNEILLTEPVVTRHHARIRRIQKGDAVSFTIADLNSRHGTLLNGEKIEKTTDLKNGDVIQIGKTQMKFWYTEW